MLLSAIHQDLSEVLILLCGWVCELGGNANMDSNSQEEVYIWLDIHTDE